MPEQKKSFMLFFETQQLQSEAARVSAISNLYLS
jgi:hypothetical protein